MCANDRYIYRQLHTTTMMALCLICRVLHYYALLLPHRYNIAMVIEIALLISQYRPNDMICFFFEK